MAAIAEEAVKLTGNGLCVALAIIVVCGAVLYFSGKDD